MRKKLIIITVILLSLAFFAEYYINAKMPEIVNRVYFGNRIKGMVSFKLEDETVVFRHNPYIKGNLNHDKALDFVQGSRDFATRFELKGSETGTYNYSLKFSTNDFLPHYSFDEKMLPLLGELKNLKRDIILELKYEKKNDWSMVDIKTTVTFRKKSEVDENGSENFVWVYEVEQVSLTGSEEARGTFVTDTKEFIID